MHPLLRVLQLPLNQISPETRMRVLLGPLRGASWVVGSGNHVCWIGIYEYQKQLVLTRTLRRGSTVYDIGAHVGFHSLLASRLVGPSGRVCAFEPFPRNVRYLREHVALNNASNVQVIEAAVADQAGEETFSEHGSYMGKLRAGAGLSVKTVAIDPLVKGGTLPHPDYVKMDVEGAEARALRGMRDTLAAFRPTLFLSTHSPDLHRECIEFLNTLGYSLRPLTGRTVLRTDELVAERPNAATSISR